MTSPKTRNILDDAADLLRKHAPSAYSPVPGPPTNPELRMDAEVLPLHITITVHGGCVVDVDGLPDDATYTIDDRDIQAHQ